MLSLTRDFLIMLSLCLYNDLYALASEELKLMAASFLFIGLNPRLAFAFSSVVKLALMASPDDFFGPTVAIKSIFLSNLIKMVNSSQS